MWVIVDLIVLMVGIGLVLYAKRIDSSENYFALLFFIVGVLITVSGLFSEAVRWVN